MNHKVRHWLYILLLILGISLLLISESENSIKIASIIESIGCGVIASVIIAWLIDVSNCTSKNKELTDARIAVLTPFQLDFALFLFSFRTLAVLHDSRIENEKNNRRKWAEYFQVSNASISIDQKSHIIDKFTLIENVLAEIQDDKLLYISQHILTTEEITSLLEVKTDITALKFELCANELSQIVLVQKLDELYEHINEASSVLPVNDIKFNSNLNDLLNVFGKCGKYNL